MRFKLKLSLVVLITTVISFFIVSCGLNSGEKAYVPVVPNITNDFSCIDNVGKRFEKYFNGELEEAGINEFFDCAKKAMFTFKERTDGTVSGDYTPEELRVYLYKFFIRNNTITDDLLLEAMRIKQTMVGGSLYKLTKDEIEKGIDLLELIKQKAILLRPHVSVIYPNAKNKMEMTPKKVDAALEAMQDVANGFGAELAKNIHAYNFESFNNFVGEFRKFLNWENNQANDASYLRIIDWIELAKAFKNLIFYSNEMQIASHEWTPFLRQSSGWFGVYLRFRHTIRDWDRLLFGQGLKNVDAFANNVFGLFKKLFEYQRPSVIKYNRIFKVVTVLQRLNLMPFGIKSETIQTVLPEYIKRGFVQIKLPLSERKVYGISLEAINNIEYEYNLWANIQKTLDKGKTKDGRVEFNERYKYVDVNDCSENVNPTRYVKYECELARIRNERPMFVDGFNTAYIVRASEVGENGFENLSKLNVVRAAVRTLILLYGSYETTEERKRTLNQLGITKGELETFYVTSKKLGVDINLMDEKGQKVGERAFMESKLFTYAGKGLSVDDPNDLTTYSELVQLLSTLYSGGNIGNNIFDVMSDENTGVCPLVETVEENVADPKFSFECFKKHFYNYRANYLGTSPEYQDDEKRKDGTLPGMKVFFENMPEVDFDELMNPFYKMALGSDFDGENIERSDFTFMFTVLHYIEITMTNFDVAPADNIMDFNEASEAYERFQDFFEGFDLTSLAPKFKIELEKDLKPTDVSEEVIVGWFESFSGFFGNLGNFFVEIGAEIGDGVSKGWNSTKRTVAVNAYRLINTITVKKQNDEEFVEDITEEEIKKIVTSRTFGQEVRKAYFYLLLAEEKASFVQAVYEAVKIKFGGDYSSNIKNLKVDRAKLINVFVGIIGALTGGGSENIPDDDDRTPPVPIEDDFRNPTKKQP